MSSNNDVLLFYGAVSKLSEYYNKLFQEGLFSKVNTNVKEKKWEVYLFSSIFMKWLLTKWFVQNDLLVEYSYNTIERARFFSLYN